MMGTLTTHITGKRACTPPSGRFNGIQGGLMAKDPAFLFYFQDFLVGTTFLSLEETGAYIKLLCFLADKGSLTEEQILKKIPPLIWDSICGKFCNDGGNIYHPRLREEVEKRQSYTTSRRKNLHMGKHKGSPYDEVSGSHMENEDEDVSLLVDYWNNKKELPSIVIISSTRKKKLLERFKSKHFKENWKDAIDKISESSFCKGSTGWKVSIDWFVANDNNYIKAMEGKYDDKRDRFSAY